MKNILKINAVIVILFSSLLIFFDFKNNDSSYWMNWGKTPNSQTIYLRNTGYSGSDLYNMLTNLADENEVNLIKTDYLVFDDEETIVKSIYQRDEKDDLFHQDRILEGVKLTQNDNHTNEYISTKENDKKSCKGIMFDFLNDDNVEIWTLTKFMNERGSLDGDYIIRCTNPRAIETFIRELSNRSGIDEKDLLQQKTFVSIEESPIQVMAKIGIVISVIVFGILSLYYAIDNSKKIGVMKLNAYGNFEIWKELIAPIMEFIIITIVIKDVMMALLLDNITLSFISSITKMDILIMISLLVTSLLIYVIIRRNKISNLVKNKKSIKHILSLTYVVKSLLLLLLIVLTIAIGSGMKYAGDEFDKMKYWDEVSDLAVLVNLETGDDAASIRQGDITLDKDFAQYYDELSSKGAIYTQVVEFSPHVQFKQMFDENTGDLEYVDYFDPTIVPQNYTTLTYKINSNYLHEYPIEDENGNKIKVNNTKERVILIPESKKDEQKQIEEIYKAAYIDEIKAAKRKQGIDTNKKENVEIRSIIYKENKNGYFAFNSRMEESDFKVYEPVFEVLTKDNMTLLEKANCYIQGIDSPLKINLQGTTSKAFNSKIEPLLNKYNLEDNHLKYMTIGEVFATQINSLKNMCRQYAIALCIVLVIMVIITVHLTKLMIDAKKQRYCIQKLYGYTFIDRYKGIILLNIIINMLIAIIALALGPQLIEMETTLLSIEIIISLLIVDLLITIILIRYFENKGIIQIVKGE